MPVHAALSHDARHDPRHDARHDARSGFLPLAMPHRAVRAITYGTYDLFHVGHVNLFRRIRERCDHLIVAVSTDEFNAVKGKTSAMCFADRSALVAACRYVDEVIAETAWDQKERDIVQHHADLFVMGDDWAGRFDHLAPLCEVLYLPRTEGVSSTSLKKIVTAQGR